jgi:hypothetical protein
MDMNKKPKADAKINQIKFTVSNDELQQLNFICEFYNLSRASLFRLFLDETYKKTKKNG